MTHRTRALFAVKAGLFHPSDRVPFYPKYNEHIIINTNNNMIITFTDKVTVPTDMRREGEIGKSERAAKRFASTPTPRSALVPGSS